MAALVEYQAKARPNLDPTSTSAMFMNTLITKKLSSWLNSLISQSLYKWILQKSVIFDLAKTFARFKQLLSCPDKRRPKSKFIQ